METLIQHFTMNMDKSLWTAFLVLAIYFILKKEPFRLITYYTDRRDRHHEFARMLLDSGKLTNEANEFLRENLEKAAFLQYCGIRADAHMRSRLINFHKQYFEEISWTLIRRAYLYIHLTKGSVSIKINRHDHIRAWISTTLTFLGRIHSLLAMTVAIASSQSTSQLIEMTLLSLLLLGATMCFTLINLPYHAARRIDKIIRRTNI